MLSLAALTLAAAGIWGALRAVLVAADGVPDRRGGGWAASR